MVGTKTQRLYLAGRSHMAAHVATMTIKDGATAQHQLIRVDISADTP